jgi:hypothetical protein
LKGFFVTKKRRQFKEESPPMPEGLLRRYGIGKRPLSPESNACPDYARAGAFLSNMGNVAGRGVVLAAPSTVVMAGEL